MPNTQTKQRTRTHTTARKMFLPEFNKSTLVLKVVIDTFMRMVAHIFLSAGLLDEEDSIFDPDQHLGLSDLGEMIVVAGKNIDWKNKTSIPKICLWLSSVALVLFVFTGIIILLMSIVTNVSMAMAQTTGTYDELFTLSKDVLPAQGEMPDRTLAQTEYGTTWINWLFNLSGQPMPLMILERGEAATEIGVAGIAPGFKSMLVYYSSACLVLGSIMITYLFIDAVIDTASTGKFMGDKDEVWAFPRILIAMCFLVPY